MAEIFRKITNSVQVGSIIWGRGIMAKRLTDKEWLQVKAFYECGHGVARVAIESCLA